MSDLSVALTPETPSDAATIEKLNERAFGPGRFARTAYRLREGAAPDYALSFVARVGTLVVGANRMTPILIGASPALLLGPLIVDPVFRSRGIGAALVKRSIDAAKERGHKLILLVGDEPYYGRLGFKRIPNGRVVMPGPVDPARVLICEAQDGAFEGVNGAVLPAA